MDLYEILTKRSGSSNKSTGSNFIQEAIEAARNQKQADSTVPPNKISTVEKPSAKVKTSVVHEPRENNTTIDVVNNLLYNEAVEEFTKGLKQREIDNTQNSKVIPVDSNNTAQSIVDRNTTVPEGDTNITKDKALIITEPTPIESVTDILLSNQNINIVEPEDGTATMLSGALSTILNRPNKPTQQNVGGFNYDRNMTTPGLGGVVDNDVIPVADNLGNVQPLDNGKGVIPNDELLQYLDKWTKLAKSKDFDPRFTNSTTTDLSSMYEDTDTANGAALLGDNDTYEYVEEDNTTKLPDNVLQAIHNMNNSSTATVDVDSTNKTYLEEVVNRIPVNEGEKGDGVTDIPTGMHGLTAATYEAMKTKSNNPNLTEKEAIQMYVFDIDANLSKVSGYSKQDNNTKKALIDLAYNTGGIAKFPALQKEISDPNATPKSILHNTLDIVSVEGKSVKGIAKRRAEMYNSAVDPKDKISSVTQLSNGTIEYKDVRGNIILRVPVSGGVHNASEPGTINLN
ncbi:MAG: hypothetical protein U9Q66_03745 [Patescibacteria group bacterium]|nr:hypothetical protein [Patescibacteria group bacterium]